MKLKQKIKSFAYSKGFDMVRFTNAEPFSETKAILKKRMSEGYKFPFKMNTVDRVTDPKKMLENAQTIISLGMSYSVSKDLLPPKPDDRFIGKISRYAWGIDYHRVMIKKMNALGRYIRSITGSNYKVFVDTGSIIDKAAAQRSGIGWISKNTCLTNVKYGTWLFLGEIILDVEIEPDSPDKNQCGDCERCLDLCPTGALYAPYKIDPAKCLSYLTQKRGWVPWEFREKFGDRLYGCDTCQEGCSANQNIVSGNHKEFLPVVLKPYIRLFPLFEMTNKQFKKAFGRSAAGWVGKRTILRNAVIVLGNYEDEGAKDCLLKALNHPSAIIRGHASWALAKCLKTKALPYLEEADKKEQHSEVKSEIKKSIKMIHGDGSFVSEKP